VVISGINSGLNAGINVLYSGTVAAAIEGSFFGITSIAVSLEWDDHAEYDKAASLARRVIEQVLAQKNMAPQLYNLNIPTTALSNPTSRVQVVPMGLSRWGDQYEKRIDPRGRPYFWAVGDKPPVLPEEGETDVLALRKGHVTLTPLHFDLTSRGVLETMRSWRFEIAT
jgi:5'-nucleotidase